MGDKPIIVVDGINEELGAKLAAKGFDKAYILLGQFLLLKKECATFQKWLKLSYGASSYQAERCALSASFALGLVRLAAAALPSGGLPSRGSPHWAGAPLTGGPDTNRSPGTSFGAGDGAGILAAAAALGRFSEESATTSARPRQEGHAKGARESQPSEV
ncbi:barrier-to-autointegration factor [Podarcis lilfordi]|uniref:Barrier-to-autointegration factor n=1 Tax=Podarcis lilfordi TaxID=74358 RepID=A0AA35PCJ3_9SAUR|nr:barrier-to-autointegration factor [Podarcis lilfordi]